MNSHGKYPLIPVLLIVLTAFWGQPVLAASDDALYQYAETAEKELMRDGKAQVYRHNWLNVIDRYKRVIKNNANSEAAQRSLLKIGDLYVGLYKRSNLVGDLNEALDYYTRLTKRFPKDRLAAEAQFKIGEVYHYHKKDTDRAYVEYLKVTLNFSHSAQAELAHERMAQISGSPPPDKKVERPAATASKSLESGPQTKALVKNVRQWSTPFYTRVVIDLDSKTEFRDHLLRPNLQLNKPMRLYLDLYPSRMSPDIKDVLPIPNQLLRQVRVAQHDSNTVRVVMDIESIQNYKIFALKDPFRIVIDMTGKEQPLVATTTPQSSDQSPQKTPLTDLRDTAKKRKKVPRGPAQQDPSQTSLARQLGLGVKKIVIDPGHGGKDRGATGITGLIEKDVTLKVAQALAKKIEDATDIECILTRTKDVYMTLEERTAIANANQADLFISIHCNAHPKSSIHGIETYFLNLTEDKEAMRVAARENATTTKHMSDLEVILNDLMLNSKINESSRLARDVQSAMVEGVRKRYKNIKDMGVKQAPFYVLIGANMPSILIELAFISNRAEEKRMRTQNYLDAMADGIIVGINSYAQSIKMSEAK